MKSIYTLIPDIQELLKTKGWMTHALAEEFSHEIETRFKSRFNRAETPPTLRLSGMGPRCPKALWASIHAPAEAEPLPPWAEFKFAYGDVAEALTLCLAKAAGHEVVGEQDAIIVDGITGHRDAVIDGCIVDVKSCSSRAFQKFREGSIAKDDPFGYLDQIDGYVVGSHNDPLVRIKDRGYLLAVDKTLGKMVLYEHKIREHSIRQRIAEFKQIVLRDRPPDCTCACLPDGKSGNIKLDVKASYNIFKHFCNPSIRTFIYSDGPRYLTKVVRTPDVPEINKVGKIIYRP